MATYNSYEEAKIANPECEIVVTTRKNIDEFGATFEFLPVVNSEKYESGYKYKYRDASPRINDGYYELCNPADYCVTVEKFLADGHKFVEGDLILNVNRIINETRGDMTLMFDNEGVADYNHDRFVLRAAALETKETPLLQTGEDFEHSKALNFIRDRLIDVHGENASLDYMHKLSNAIAFVDRMEDVKKNCGGIEPKVLRGAVEIEQEKPKRTKVGYEKVEFATDYEHLKLMIDGESFYSWDGDIKYSFNGARFISEEAPNHVGRAEWTTKRPTELHRRIETEITEREEFIDRCVEVTDDSHGSESLYYQGWFKCLYDNGCRFVD